MEIEKVISASLLPPRDSTDTSCFFSVFLEHVGLSVVLCARLSWFKPDLADVKSQQIHSFIHSFVN